jgi:hypothetical protein
LNRCCLAEAAYAQGKCEIAQAYLLDALRDSAERQLWPRVNLALYHLGAMQAAAGVDPVAPTACDRLTALAESLRLLYVVANQPTCWHVYRRKAEKIAAGVESELPGDLVAQIRTQSEQQSLDQVVEDLLSCDSPF